MTEAVTTRLARQSDAAEINSLINAAFAPAESFFLESERTNLDEVNACLEKGVFLVAQKRDKLVGCVYLEQQGDRTYLGLLSVDPECQESGIGSLLMRASEDLGRERGSKFMDVKVVNLRTDLQPYYRKRGYVETGTSPFPEGVVTKLPCWLIDMSKPLA